MAKKRMFSNIITDSDAFHDMSPTAQNLYFHLNMHADDDGFVSSPKRIMRMIGAKDDDYKILIAKRFILVFESGVCVIKHWLIHNTLRSDRHKNTVYLDEKNSLKIKDNKAFTENGNHLATIGNHSIDKVRLDKDRIDKTSTEQAEALTVKENKKVLGEFENVKLTDREISELIERIGENNCSALIEELSQYMASQGKRYKSHYATLLAWNRRKTVPQNKSKTVTVIK